MKPGIQGALLLGAALLPCFHPQPALGQACKDEEMIATEYKKSIVDFVDTVKKESLADFQKSYHQKNCLNKLTFSISAINALLGCLDKAVQDTGTTKEDAEALKAKRAAYDKLKGKIEHDRDALKATEEAKSAKALIEKIDLSN